MGKHSAINASRRELAAVERKLDGLIDAIAGGLKSGALQRQLDELEKRKAELERSIAATPLPAPRMHPALAETYRQQVADLQTALRDADNTEALEATRGLIERVVLYPAADRSGLEIELDLSP